MAKMVERAGEEAGFDFPVHMPCERRPALGHKHLPTVGPVAAQLSQRSDFITVERVRRRHAILLPVYVDQSGARVDLIPAQFT